MRKWFNWVSRLKYYVPIILKGEEVDRFNSISFSLDLFISSLKRTLEIQSKKDDIQAHEQVKRLSRIIRLYNRINNRTYLQEFQEDFEKRYGDWYPVVDSEGEYRRWQKAVNKIHNKEIERVYFIQLEEAIKKHEKDEDLLWELVKDEARKWLD